VILEGESSDGRFVGDALLVWTVPMSTMGLIIFPKVLLVRRMQRKADAKDDEASALQSNGSVGRETDSNGDAATSTGPADSTTAVAAEAAVLPLSGPRIQIVIFD
jgi:hypothetical protein